MRKRTVVVGADSIRLYGPLPRSVGEAKFLALLTERPGAMGAATVSLRGGNWVFVCDLATLSCQ